MHEYYWSFTFFQYKEAKMTKSERRWLVVLVIITVIAAIPIIVLNAFILRDMIGNRFNFRRQRNHVCYDIFENCSYDSSAKRDEVLTTLGVELDPMAAEV